MRVLVHEHFTSGGQSDVTSAGGAFAGADLDDYQALLAAGQGMLKPLVADLMAAGAKVTVTLGPHLAIDLPMDVERVTAGSASHAFAMALPRVDAAIVVAPESDDTLATATLVVEQAGIRNLGSASAAIRSAADKLLLSKRLAAAGVPTPATAAGLGQAPAMLARHGTIIVKPRKSAGCVDTFVCGAVDELGRLPSRDDWLVQERVPGLAASAAFVVMARGIAPLRAGSQAITAAPSLSSTPARLAYEGGRLPLDAALEARALALGRAAIAQVPGLRGFVGVDLVLGADPAHDRVIEINPRVTLAYAALRAVAGFSIAELILGGNVAPAWNPDGVRYDAAGHVAGHD
jgi:predicted ATP-grasp superfamily ATP-dependent carboligase